MTVVSLIFNLIWMFPVEELKLQFREVALSDNMACMCMCTFVGILEPVLH